LTQLLQQHRLLTHGQCRIRSCGSRSCLSRLLHLSKGLLLLRRLLLTLLLGLHLGLHLLLSR